MPSSPSWSDVLAPVGALWFLGGTFLWAISFFTDPSITALAACLVCIYMFSLCWDYLGKALDSADDSR